MPRYAAPEPGRHGGEYARRILGSIDDGPRLFALPATGGRAVTEALPFRDAAFALRRAAEYPSLAARFW
jgi:hypothetical protein